MGWKFVNIILFLLIGSQNDQTIAQSIYATTNDGRIYKLNIEGCADTLLCKIDQNVIVDIAFNDGLMYGINYQSVIYRIDTANGKLDSLSSLKNDATSMVSDEKGNLYIACTNDSLYQFNITSHSLVSQGSTGNYQAAGDLAYFNDTLYMTNINYELIRIVLNPYSCSTVGFINLFGKKLYGLASVINQGVKSLIVSATYTTNFGISHNDIYKIDRNNASVTQVCTDIMGHPGVYPPEIWGLASRIQQTIPEVKDCKISAYPIPANDFIYLQNINHSSCGYILTLFDVLGQLIFSQDIVVEDQYSLDVSALSSGIYILNLRNQEENQTHKFIVK